MTPDEIMRKVEIDIDGCWLWLGNIYDGAPKLWLSRPRGHRCARRYIYEQKHGPIPKGQYTICPCLDQACVNPDHTKLTTRRGVFLAAKKRGVTTPDAAKHAKIALAMRAKGKLNWEKVRAIRASTEPGWVFAERFGVSVSAVQKIRRGEMWVEPGLASMFQQMRRAA